MPEETKELLRQLHEDNAAVREAIGAEQRSRRRLVAAVAAAAVVFALFTWRAVATFNCTATRSNALSGPGNARVNLFLQGYNEAAGAVHKPLTAAQRAEIIAGLDQARRHFTVIPAHAVLAKDPDPQLLGLRDLIASLRANDDYRAAAKNHPVCSLWSV